jgi:signal transduction histidine kinase
MMSLRSDVLTDVPAARIFYDIAHGFESPVDPEPRIRRALVLLRRIVPYDRCALLGSPSVGPPIFFVEPDAPEEREGLGQLLGRLLTVLAHEPAPDSSWMTSEVEHLRPWPSHLGVPLIGLDRVRGVLLVGRRKANAYTEDHVRFLSIAASQIAAYLTACELSRDINERKRTERSLREGEGQLRALAGQLQAAREEERRRVAREIHDELGQVLTGLKMKLTKIALDFGSAAPTLRHRLHDTAALVDETIAHVRRIATELRPGVLDVTGLQGAIEWLTQEFSSRVAIPCTVTLTPDELPVSSAITVALFRVCQEALTNVARHAGAKQVEIVLERAGGALVLTVRDNGRGIAASELAGPGALGILGMRERVHFLGGSVAISGDPKQGTTLTVEIPVEPSARDPG